MAITNKKLRSDLLLGNALRNGTSITRPTDINISKPTITTTQNNIAPNAVGVPSEAYAHANGTYEPQLLTPVGETAKAKTTFSDEILTDEGYRGWAKKNFPTEYNEWLQAHPEFENKPVEPTVQDNGNNKSIVKYPEEQPQVSPEPDNKPSDSNVNTTVDYENDANPYKSRVDELQAIIDKMNADKKASDDEFAKQLAEQKKAYDDLRNNSIDLLKGNNDEAWKDQKNRINQSALNYKSELDAINQKSSMYYDDYLEMLGLKGSGAGAGLYNDMAVQNANAATQIEANRQNEIENARQANTDRLMALLDEAREKGITLNDEELKDILGTYSKDSLAAGTDAEATRWNRFSNLANAKKEKDEAEAKAQAELDNKDKVIANFASSMLEQGYTAEQIREAIKQFDDIVDESGEDNRTPTQRLLDATKVLEGTQEEQSQTGGKDELTLPEKQTQLANMKTVAEEQPDEFKAAITYYGTSLGSSPNTATGNTVNTALDVVKNSQKMYTNAEFIKDTSLAKKFFEENAKIMVDDKGAYISVSDMDSAFKEAEGILNKAFDAAKEGKLPDGTTIIPKRGKNDNYGVAYTYIGGYWYVGKCAWNADGVMTKEQLDKVIQ